MRVVRSEVSGEPERTLGANRSGPTGSGAGHRIPCRTRPRPFLHTWPTPKSHTRIDATATGLPEHRSNVNAGGRANNSTTASAYVSGRTGTAPVRWFHRLGDVAQ